MFIASFPAGPWQTNCYLVAIDAGEACVVVDPGMGALEVINEAVAEHRLKPVAVLVTHGHLDHTFSVTPLCAEYATSAWVHSLDRVLLSDPARALGEQTRAMLDQLAPGRRFVEPDDVREIGEGAQVEVAGLRFDVLHAPGHTPGSVLFTTPHTEETELVFSGDVLFAGSIGRTDLPGGSAPDMLESLRTKVLTLPDRALVLPGHGPQTTMAQERASNPYLQADFLRSEW